MAIVATAPVPAHLRLMDADTVEIHLRPLAERVRVLVHQNLTLTEVATRLAIPAHVALVQGAHLRNRDDVHAVAAALRLAGSAS